MSDEVDKFCMEKGFTFQPSFFKQINRKAKVSDRERAYRYICSYMFQGKVPDIKEDDILADFWDGTYPTLHKSKALVLAKQKEDTTGSTSPSTSKSTSGSTSPSGDQVQREHNAEYFYQGNGIGNGNGYKDKGEGESHRNIAAPTFEDVQNFAEAEKLRTDTRKFYNYYSARDWKTNGEPVHDWKALLRVWASRDKAEEKPEKPEETFKPITDFKKCPVCGSEEVSQKGMYAMCLSSRCGKTFTWTNNKWRLDK